MYNENDLGEYLLPEKMVILSTSDLKGNIVEYNQAFRDASGYTDAELLGKAHNLLRHPDMPKEAFKDFWQTIQAGCPWFGIVKNKRKNGQYYWVAANATPIKKQGKIVGYLSVRYPASVVQKNQAASLYQAVKAGQTKFPYTVLPSNRTSKLKIGIASAAVVSSFAFIGLLNTPLSLLSLPIALAGLGYLAWAGYRKDHFPQDLEHAIEDIANGQFKDPIRSYSKLGFSLNMIRSRIAEAAAKNYDTLYSNQVLMTAMDTASTNMMVADSHFTIKSINKSLKSMFERNEAKLKQALPNFSLESVVGSNMDIFHKNPSHQRQMVAQLTTSWSGELKVAGLVLRLTVDPVYLDGNKIGYVVEWLDRTEEAEVASEIIRVMGDMENGHYDSRITAQATGELNAIKQAINASMDVLSDSVSKIGLAMGAQAQGDLTFELPEGKFKGQLHDLKNSINYAFAKVNTVVSVVSEAADNVRATSEEVAQASLGLSSRVQEQAAALEQTSATMEQMNSTIQQTSANTQQASKLAFDVQQKARQGSHVMKETISAMQGIKDSSQQIAEIVTLIDSIAFQTNLLALNAAVEAARAGDNGRGFAVVAGEVRALAQKSAEAAKDIKALIQDSVYRIEEGTRLADASGASLNEIMESVDAVTNLVENIANATKEQALGMHQVHEAIGNIDGATQQNAALVEETAAAADSLKEQSGLMHDEISFFKLSQTAKAKPLQKPSTQTKAKARLPIKQNTGVVIKKNLDEWAEF